MKHLPIALAAAVLLHAQQSDTKSPADPASGTRRITCGDPSSEVVPGSFDPACYVRIFEDYGGRRRAVLYSPRTPYRFNRPLSADPDSTLVIDFAEGLHINRDVGLNNMLVRARITRGEATTPIQVINYSEIGVSNTAQQSQKAFGFQTFDNVAAALFNLFWTARDIIFRLEEGHLCYNALLTAKAPGLALAGCPSLVRPDPAALERAAKRISGIEAEISELERQMKELRWRERELDLETRLAAAERTPSPRFNQSLIDRRQVLSSQIAALSQSVSGKRNDLSTVQASIPNLQRSKSEFDRFEAAFSEALRLYGPEARELIRFFQSNSNRTVASEISHRVFGVDYQSMLAITKQIEDDMAKLADEKVSEDGKRTARLEIANRVYNIINTLADANAEIRAIGKLAVKELKGRRGPLCKPGGKTPKICDYCPATVDKPPAFVPDPATQGSQKAITAFAQACYIESQRGDYVGELERLLVTGTVSLRENAAKPGDLVTLEIEARGADPESRGAIAKFEIRVEKFGWKPAATGSVLFIERLNVTQPDQNREGDPIRKIRFQPVPGFNLGTTFHHRGDTPFAKNETRQSVLSASDYELPARGPFHKFIYVLAPGLGLNASLMNFDAESGKVQLGVGPIATLFDNRVSATYGWNLMARERRAYWGLGFSFLEVGKDVVGFFTKKQ